MPSLRESQRAFADALFAPGGAAPAFAIAGSATAADRIAIYRSAVFANYRNALRATYPVVQRIVGIAFFNTAVDAHVRAHPSASGDLNIYGAAFGSFLAEYLYAAHLPYLPDVARLEWAFDEAQRAQDVDSAPAEVLAALASTTPDEWPALRLRLHPSCRLVSSPHPVLRIWQVNQPAYDGDQRVDFDAGADALLVRREPAGVSIARVPHGDEAWLMALAAGKALADALDAAIAADAEFDVAAALRSNIGTGIIAGIIATQRPEVGRPDPTRPAVARVVPPRGFRSTIDD